jgi:hypothetical protein
MNKACFPGWTPASDLRTRMVPMLWLPRSCCPSRNRGEGRQKIVSNSYIAPLDVTPVGLPEFLKADERLHQALDIGQSILLELEMLDSKTPNRSVKKLTDLVLKQSNLIADTRKQLRTMAPSDSPIFTQLQVAASH